MSPGASRIQKMLLSLLVLELQAVCELPDMGAGN